MRRVPGPHRLTSAPSIRAAFGWVIEVYRRLAPGLPGRRSWRRGVLLRGHAGLDAAGRRGSDRDQRRFRRPGPCAVTPQPRRSPRRRGSVLSQERLAMPSWHHRHGSGEPGRAPEKTDDPASVDRPASRTPPPCPRSELALTQTVHPRSGRRTFCRRGGVRSAVEAGDANVAGRAAIAPHRSMKKHRFQQVRPGPAHTRSRNRAMRRAPSPSKGGEPSCMAEFSAG